MITWTEEDKAQLRGWIQRGLGKKFLAKLHQDLPEIKATTGEHYSLLAAEKEGMMKQLRLIEGPMSTPIEIEGPMMKHADMSRD